MFFKNEPKTAECIGIPMNEDKTALTRGRHLSSKSDGACYIELIPMKIFCCGKL